MLTFALAALAVVATAGCGGTGQAQTRWTAKNYECDYCDAVEAHYGVTLDAEYSPAEPGWPDGYYSAVIVAGYIDNSRPEGHRSFAWYSANGGSVCVAVDVKESGLAVNTYGPQVSGPCT